MWIEIILEEQTSTCKRGTETLLFPNDSTCPEGTASAHEVALAPACFAFAWAPFQGAVEEPGFVIRFPSGRFPAHVSTHSHFWSLRQSCEKAAQVSLWDSHANKHLCHLHTFLCCQADSCLLTWWGCTSNAQLLNRRRAGKKTPPLPRGHWCCLWHGGGNLCPWPHQEQLT